MPSIFDRIYKVSPVWLQNFGISMFGLAWERRRFGGVFREKLKEFKEREKLSDDQWSTYQKRHLQMLLIHAAQNVPFYQNLFQSIGLSYDRIEEFNLAELHQIPLLEKNDIRKQQDAFISRKTDPKRLHTYLTSGTTGTPLAIKWSTRMQQTWAAAYEARCRNWAGVNHHMSRAMIGGRLVVPKPNASSPFWRYNFIERQLYMSAFHISPTNIKSYVEGLNKYKPDYLVGYASGHYFLSKMIEEQGLYVHQPRAVLTSSENLTPEMRATIEKTYECDVFDAYSGVEACCLVSECEYHSLHISPDVGLIEIIDENGVPVGLDQPGEIVATGFLNYDQPLIRYRTGDWAVISSKSCPCGRSMPVLKELLGRIEDTVTGLDGRKMVRFHGIFIGLPTVKEGQVIQENLFDFRLNLVVDPVLSEFGSYIDL